MTVRLLRGDCRETLPTLEAGSCQAAITSPPYYGLRDYGLPPLVWPGRERYCTCGRKDFCLASCGEDHEHEWGPQIPGDPRGGSGPNAKESYGPDYGRQVPRGAFCRCGAWLGSLGLEPTPDLYVVHLVEVFRQVRRVLRDDGVLWLNLGDSYAGSGKGPSNSIQGDASQIGPSAQKKRGLHKLQDTPTVWLPVASQGQRIGSVNGQSGHTSGVTPPPGYKPKDLLMIPFRVALALQADGWYLRSVIPWLKRNVMPEHYDRPSTSVEYVFLLAKSRTYYWDAGGVRAQSAPSSTARAQYNGGTPNPKSVAGAAAGVYAAPVSTAKAYGQGRNRRNGDWFFDSWQGLLADENDEPLALIVNPTGYKGAHYATFPPKLVEPMIKASSRSGDTLLDPFSGSGTVGMVADRHSRNAILCELSDDYTAQAVTRVTGEAPMFTEVVT